MSGNLPSSEGNMGNEHSQDPDDTEDHGHSSENESSDGTAGDNSCDDGSDDSLDGTLDKCPICLRVFRQQEVGTPDTCEHCFCLKCIMEWAENVTTCPIDRKVFHSVLVLDKVRGHVVRVQELSPPTQHADYYDDFSDPTFCEVCGCCDREDRLLLCDDCDDGYHLECLDPPLHSVPDADWWCPNCSAARVRTQSNLDNASTSNTSTRPRSRMPRTGLSRRIMQRRRRDTTLVNLCSPHSDDCETATRRLRSESSSAGRSSRRSVSRGRRRTTSRRNKSAKRCRGKKRRTRKRRVAKERKPATSRGRLIQQLGIVPPRPGQVYVGLPSCRPSHAPVLEPTTSASAIRTQRHQAGIAPLRIYSTVNDLADYFEGSSDEEAGVGVMRRQGMRISDTRKRVLASAAAHQSSSANILGPILSGQHILLQDKNMQISSSDGRLVPSISVDVDKLLLSPNHENDSSGYDSFGNRGSPVSRRPNILTSAITSPGQSAYEPSRSGSSGDSSAQSSSPSTSSTFRAGSSSGSYNNPSSSSYNRGSEDPNAFEDLSGLDEAVKCAQRKKDNSTESDKEEDEFNIYSDIEDDPRPITRRSLDVSVGGDVDTGTVECLNDGGGGAESDDEMVIDEAEAASAQDPDKRSEVESTVPSQKSFPSGLVGSENEDAISENGSEPLPGDVEPDSPLSIPLPDSTPPPSVRGGPSLDDEESHELSSADEKEGKGQGKDEYDPSQPLTSDDECEVPLPASDPILSTWETKGTGEGSSEPPQCPTPLAPPTDEGRRPTIQFSIPSRHRLFSMGSLMRRNTGVMKKEVKGGSLSFQSEMSKAFAVKGAEEGGTAGTEGEKMSLVAEIFGSDEDEEEGLPPLDTIHTNQQLTSTTQVDTTESAQLDPPPVESTTESASVEGNKWKKIVEDPPAPPQVPPEPLVQEESEDEVVVIGETPAEVQIIETPPPEPEDEPPKGEEEDAKEGAITIALAKVLDESEFKTPSPVSRPETGSETEAERQGLKEKRQSGRKSEGRRKSPKRDKGRRKRSRTLSGGSNNREEGEILDVPDKKKKKKTKKSKRRRRSTRSSTSSSSVPFSEKKIPEDVHRHVSDEEDVRRDVHWKKPSKSSKQRNYRDGKPKTEERYFREREKKLENDREKESLGRSHEREEMRKSERSRSKEQRSSRRRSSPHKRRGRSKHSNRSSSSIRNYRSRSRSLHSRSPRGRQSRHYRDHSYSPAEWHASPVRERRRSRHRSRSGNRRHLTGRKGSGSDGGRRQKRKTQSRSRSASPRRNKNVGLEPSAPKKAKKDAVSEGNQGTAQPDSGPKATEPLPDKVRNVDKEKRKKRKRREKSISPAKAIFADGDSIVVSLNFQKGKESEKDGGTEGKKDEKKSSSSKGTKDKSTKSIKKTVLIDLECSPIQEQNIGHSPTLIVLSDDEEHAKGEESDPDRLAVSTTSMGEKSPLYREGVPADSTQLQLHSNDDKGSDIHGRHSMSESDTGNTPARGDALVTSTRDSVDRNGGAQEEYLSPCSTPPKEPSTPNYPSLTPPLPPPSPTALSPQQQHKSQSSTPHIGSNPSPLVSTVATVTRPTVGLASLPLFPPARPQGFPGSGSQLPVMLPTAPQLRLPPSNLFNQSVLATVANALYGPLMGPQPRFPLVQSGPPNPSRQGGKKTSGGTVLLPKDQNLSTQKRAEGGDSPFSPNSSDGDDLFEPPKDPAHAPTSKTTTGGQGHKGTESHSTESGGAKGKGRPAARIFDALFGGPIRKPTTSGGNPTKSDGGSKQTKSPHKSKSRKGSSRKAASNLSEGELRLTEEVPTSAVELHVKEKFLKKLNRQERVVEEVKVSLKPHYSKKHITKEEYKDILRRAVPKICHNKTGEINPIKIKELVEAYVKKIRKTKKK